MWGRTFGWKRRVGESDAEVVRALADQSLEDMAERVARSRKLVKMGLIRVAKAIAKGKMKVTMADLDRLIRLEEFLRGEDPSERPKIIIEWRDYDAKGKEIGDEEDEGE
jgi:hypothetical protein